jgi:hypothetical protein
MTSNTGLIVSIVVPLLLSGFLNFYGQRPWILYFPLLGIVILILYVGHGYIQSVSKKEKDATTAQTPEPSAGSTATSSPTAPVSNKTESSPHVDQFFAGEVFQELSTAQELSKKQNVPIFLVIYNPEHSQQSQLSYSLGYFLKYQTTKDLVRRNFIQVLADSNRPNVAPYVPPDDPLENCLLVVLSPTGQIIYREGVYANPDEGLKRVRAIISQWQSSKSP